MNRPPAPTWVLRSPATFAGDATLVLRWAARWLLLRFLGTLLWAALYTAMFLSSMGGEHADPGLRHAHLALAIAIVFFGIADLRTWVVLEDAGVVIVRGFRRTSVAWTDVRQVRARNDGSDRAGWSWCASPPVEW